MEYVYWSIMSSSNVMWWMKGLNMSYIILMSVDKGTDKRITGQSILIIANGKNNNSSRNYFYIHAMNFIVIGSNCLFLPNDKGRKRRNEFSQVISFQSTKMIFSDNNSKVLRALEESDGQQVVDKLISHLKHNGTWTVHLKIHKSRHLSNGAVRFSLIYAFEIMNLENKWNHIWRKRIQI